MGEGGGAEGEGGEMDDEEFEEDSQFPFSGPEEMPPLCRLCARTERDDDGVCPNCGNVGGIDWRERDMEAREERYAEEFGWFEEELREKRRRGLRTGAAGAEPQVCDRPSQS